MNKTYIPKSTNKNDTSWYLIDAKNQNLGRLSTKIVSILKGKNISNYTPYINPRNYIIVVNSKDIILTGQKKQQKIYKRHSGRPGKLKIRTFEEMHQKMPNKIIEKSIKGMLPKNTLGRILFKQVKVYTEKQHPHEAQKPQILI